MGRTKANGYSVKVKTQHVLHTSSRRRKSRSSEIWLQFLDTLHNLDILMEGVVIYDVLLRRFTEI